MGWWIRPGWPGAWPPRLGGGCAHLRALAGRAAPAPTARACARPRPTAEPSRARRVVLATSAFPPLVRAIRRYVVPVYDYVLVTEPLTASSASRSAGRGARASTTRQPVPLLPPDRATTGSCSAATTRSTTSAAASARTGAAPGVVRAARRALLRDLPPARGPALHPPLGRGDRHCSRFCVMFGTALGGRAVLRRRLHRPRGRREPLRRAGRPRPVDGRDTERTRLEMVRTPPVPFPPEPLRYAGITLTRRALARADRRAGPPRPLAAGCWTGSGWVSTASGVPQRVCGRRPMAAVIGGLDLRRARVNSAHAGDSAVGVGLGRLPGRKSAHVRSGTEGGRPTQGMTRTTRHTRRHERRGSLCRRRLPAHPLIAAVGQGPQPRTSSSASRSISRPSLQSSGLSRM